jgi:hypothetical protein
MTMPSSTEGGGGSLYLRSFGKTNDTEIGDIRHPFDEWNEWSVVDILVMSGTLTLFVDSQKVQQSIGMYSKDEIVASVFQFGHRNSNAKEGLEISNIECRQ